MDDSSKKLIDDCFLRVVNDARSTNVPSQSKAVSKPALKTELQVVRLTDESRKLTMETLRSIHGLDFRLKDINKYIDRGNDSVKKFYWEDRGTLMVQSVSNFSSTANNDAVARNPTEERLRRYALLKLETCGFHAVHCAEAFDHCAGDTDAALLLLYQRYMHIPEPPVTLKHDLPSETDLLDMRTDEREALESIYEKAFEEKEGNAVWNLKFKIEHLLKFSPSQVRKKLEAASAATGHQPQNVNKKKERPVCRNFEKDGTCRFGPKCRFAHVRKETEQTNSTLNKNRDNVDENENEQWFYIEVRFPPGSRYPYEAPYIFVRTTCHDIPPDVLLRLSRRLYREASEICCDGIPCIYSISELLQSEEQLIVEVDDFSFPSANRSLFYVDEAEQHLQNAEDSAPRPSHYELGQTSRDGNFRCDADLRERENRKLLQQFLERKKDSKYIKMFNSRRNLPAFAKMEEILKHIDNSQVVVVSGETGCGKSTQVPQFILDNWFFQASQKSNQNAAIPNVEIICTQPRRLSAIGVADRVAYERLDHTGRLVGYQIRLENKISASTRLTFCTTGILLKRLMSDPLLQSVTHIIVDEVHERSEESDFLLLILKRLLQRRKDLRVVLMSATLNAKLFSDYFGDVPVLNIPGRTFPVEQLFLEDILEVCNYVMECDSKFSRKFKKKDEDEFMRELEYADIKAENEAPPNRIKDEKLNLAAMYARYAGYSRTTCKSMYLMEPMSINTELIEAVLTYIVEGEHSWPRKGSILIFLPGLQEIQNLHEALTDNALFSPRAGKYLLIPLHSMLSSEEQTAVFKPAPAGKRKIVLSTNIAETSVTIDDCVFVIDCGLMKEKRFDSNRNMESLDMVWVSRANANQRKGRAGRVMPGVCIHLYTSNRFYHNILAQPVPEIQRVPLEQLVLRIKTLEVFSDLNPLDVLEMTLEPPATDNVNGALARLHDLNALDANHQLTPLGHHLSVLPVDVRIGKLMLYGAIFQCLDSVLTIAACLSHKSPFVSPFNKRAEAEKCKRQFSICNSDHLTSLTAYRKWLDVSKRSFYASRNYANEHYLSLKTLESISQIKYQFLELLVSIGFVPINLPRKSKNSTDNILELTGQQLNVNGENNRLLVSLLCAALYPNVVKIMTPERVYIQVAGGAMPKQATSRELRFKTRLDGYVNIHPSSVNSLVATFQSPFLIYQEKVRTSCIFVRECSMLPLLPLLLFAGSDFKVELHEGEFFFMVEDGWIILKAHNHETAEMIQCMRIELLKLLEEKIRDPCLNLLNHQNGRKIIENIVYLISNNN